MDSTQIGGVVINLLLSAAFLGLVGIIIKAVVERKLVAKNAEMSGATAQSTIIKDVQGENARMREEMKDLRDNIEKLNKKVDDLEADKDDLQHQMRERDMMDWDRHMYWMQVWRLLTPEQREEAGQPPSYAGPTRRATGPTSAPEVDSGS